VSLGQIVPAELFTPPPKVDSQILVLHRLPEPLFSDVNSKQFFALVKAGFSQRRKTLANSLSGGLRISRTEAAERLEKAGTSPLARAQTLSLDDWYALYQKCTPLLHN
jgi:16S rRNA (adenine1518-N6/adenine1519-N6)-dimethyltransferase